MTFSVRNINIMKLRLMRQNKVQDGNTTSMRRTLTCRVPMAYNYQDGFPERFRGLNSLTTFILTYTLFNYVG